MSNITRQFYNSITLRLNNSITKVMLLLLIFFICSIDHGLAHAGQLLFDGVPVDITTTANEDLVIVPGTGGNTQIGDATGTNTNATSNDDLHITGILETDGAAYLNSATTLGDSTSDTITVTGYLGSHFIPATDSTYDFGSSSLAWRYLYVDIISGYNAALALNPASGYSLTGSVTKNAATGNEIAYNLAATINKATAGNYTGLQLNVTQTSAPGADDRLLDLQVASVSMFRVDNAGNVTAAGTISGAAFDLTGTTANTFTINNDGTAVTSELALGAAGTTGGKISTGAGNLVIDSAGGTIDIDDGTIDLSTQTVDVTLNAAADALNFDSNTLSIDAATNRVGIATVTPQAELDVNGDILIRKQKSIAITTDATTSDFNHSIFFDQDNNVMNFKEWTTFKWTNTSPAPDVEIMTLSPTTGLNVLNDDASNNTVTDILTLRHSSTAAPAVGIGTGLSYHVEDAGGLEEQASIDTVMTNVTEGAENADMVFNVNQAGAITELMRLDAANDRLSVSGDLTITGAFTPATIGAFTAAGTIDMNTNIITNIGNAGTDFVAATGALNLADDLTLAAGADLTMSSGAGLYSQTYTGTATPMTLTANSMTTGSGISISANGLSTGNGISISSTSTAADAYKLINLSSSGAAAAGKDRYGIYSSLTGTGTGINYAGYFSASGATTNYAIYATGNPSADVANLYSENTGNSGTAGSFICSATGAGSGAKGIYVRNDGRDDVAAHIETNNANATAQTLYITNNSTQTPDVVSIVPTGATTGGNALVITNTSATNDARGMYLRNDGDGAVGAHMEINNAANASQVLWCTTNGTGYAADFIRNNATTNATHTAVELKHTVSTGGTGGADGIGVGLVFTDETSTDGTEHAAGRISGVLTTAAAATSKGDLVFEYAAAGTLSESMRLVSGGNVWFEGATDDTNEVIFSFTDPTADRTVTFPDADVNLGGVVPITGTTADTFTINSDNSANVATLALGSAADTASGAITTGVGDLAVTPAGDDLLLDGGLTVGSTTEAGDNNLRVEGTSTLVGDVTLLTSQALYFGDNNQVIYMSGDDLVFMEKEGNWMRFSTNAGEFHWFGDGVTMSNDLMSLQADGDLRVKKNFLLPDGGEIKKDDDDNHRIKFDQSSDQMEFYEYGTFDWYYAAPDPDVMTMRLSGTAGLTVLNDDANASSASDILTLTHTTSGVPANGIGTGLTFDVEDGTLSSEEQGSIDVILDDVTTLQEDSTMTFGIRKDGSAVTEIMRLDGTANRVGIGTGNDPAAKLEVNPNSTDGIGLQIDQDDVDQTALDIDTANTSGDIINLDWGGLTTQAGALTALDIDFSNLTSVAGSTTYGIHINDLNTQTTSTEYGIYQEGTNWDYGIYAADNCWFNSDIEVNNWIKVHGYINFETTNSVIGMWDTGIVNFGNTYGSGTGGVTFNLGTRPNDVFNLNIASVTYNFGTLTATGDITLSPTGNDVLPDDAGGVNLGDATYYWNDVSYKTLTDRGCLGWFDKGVELQDGRIVSDIEALKSIQPHPTKLTVYGIPMLDYQSMPKVVYKPAAKDGAILPRDKNGEPYFETEENGQKVIKPAQDGAETTALISIMIGAIKELDAQNQALRQRVAELESRL